MRNTLHELEFINLALKIADGVYDFSVPETEWKAMYGMTLKQSMRALETLRVKVQNELNRRQLKKIQRRINKTLQKP